MKEFATLPFTQENKIKYDVDDKLSPSELYNCFYILAFIASFSKEEYTYIYNTILSLGHIRYEQLIKRKYNKKEYQNNNYTENDLYQVLTNLSYQESFRIIECFDVNSETKKNLKSSILNKDEKTFMNFIHSNPSIDYKFFCSIIYENQIMSYAQSIGCNIGSSSDKNRNDLLKKCYLKYRYEGDDYNKNIVKHFLSHSYNYEDVTSYDIGFCIGITINFCVLLYNLHKGHCWDYYENPMINIPEAYLPKFKYYYDLWKKKNTDCDDYYKSDYLTIEDVGIPEFEEFRKKYIPEEVDDEKSLEDVADAIDEPSDAINKETDDAAAHKEVESAANIDEEVFTLPKELFQMEYKGGDSWIRNIKEEEYKDPKALERLINDFASQGYFRNDKKTKETFAFILTGRNESQFNHGNIIWEGDYNTLFYFIKNYTKNKQRYARIKKIFITRCAASFFVL